MMNPPAEEISPVPAGNCDKEMEKKEWDPIVAYYSPHSLHPAYLPKSICEKLMEQQAREKQSNEEKTPNK